MIVARLETPRNVAIPKACLLAIADLQTILQASPKTLIESEERLLFKSTKVQSSCSFCNYVHG